MSTSKQTQAIILPSSRHNVEAPQHRGIKSGGYMVTGQARSPKKGGVALKPSR